MLEYFRNKNILVVVAHPDDELLGLGGTINKLINDYGSNIRLVILGEGITSRSENRDREIWKKELDIHKKNITQAVSLIGYSSFIAYDFPDNRFDSLPLIDLIKVIEKEAEIFNPSIVFTHHGGDLNIDHQQVFKAVMTAFRPLKQQQVKTVLTFETPSSTEWMPSNNPFPFKPNVFIQLNEENIEAKLNAMNAYEYERRDFPHPRSDQSLKINSQSIGYKVGVIYAEAFELIRHISSD